MVRIASWAVLTPSGDAMATLSALADGTASPRRLQSALLPTLLRLAVTALQGRRPDLVLLATTKGDLDQWCDAIRADPPRLDGGPAALARALGAGLGVPTTAIVAACASGPAAVGEAARILLAGEAQCVLVLGGDRLGPFVDEGFAALGAVDPDGCKPFSADRAGISLGETAAALVLDREPGAIRVQGWGASLDAAHLTAPARDGAGLAVACRAALKRGQIAQPTLVIAHGTGTLANDDAESHAYRAVCPGTPVTAWKGGLGHSLGACGLTEIALAAQALHDGGAVPGIHRSTSVAVTAPMTLLAPGWHRFPGPWLSPNAGFGGINAAVLIGPGDPLPSSPINAQRSERIDVDHRGWISETGTRSGQWNAPAAAGHLQRPTSRHVLGHVDPSWGRMDGPSRVLVHLGQLLGPWPSESAVILLSERGCLEVDIRFEHGRRAGQIDRQAFAYTLPSTPIGEVSIRLGLHGTGFALMGGDDDGGRRCARRLLDEGAPAVLLARIEMGGTEPELAWAERWEGRKNPGV